MPSIILEGKGYTLNNLDGVLKVRICLTKVKLAIEGWL